MLCRLREGWISGSREFAPISAVPLSEWGFVAVREFFFFKFWRSSSLKSFVRLVSETLKRHFFSLFPTIPEFFASHHGHEGDSVR